MPTRSDDRFSRIGGHCVLDLINTVSWRLDPERTVDHLPTYQAFLSWARQFDVLSEREAADLGKLAADSPSRRVDDEHDRVVAVRELGYAGLRDASRPAVDELATRYAETLAGSRLSRSGPGWGWTDEVLTLRTPRDRIIREMIALLTSDDVGLLHQCEDVACGWIYLDTSPRRNRRWCAASDCGNRNRARRHYARQAGARQAGERQTGIRHAAGRP